MPDYSKYSLVPEEAPKAQLVDQPSNVSNIVPDMDVHDPVTYGSLTADHALRQLHAQGIPVNFDQYINIQNKAMDDALQYQSHQREMGKSKALEEYYKQAELQPGGIEEQKALLAKRAELVGKQLEQGPSATALAAKEGDLPSAANPLGKGIISQPNTEEQKNWPAYVEGFHSLQTMHQLFDQMATKTAGAGGPVQSLAGLTSKIVDLTSPEARIYNSYKESSLIPLAKSIMGDAATTAGRENVQQTMANMGFPTEADTVQTGGQKLFTFYQRALDKIQTERNFARKNGRDTGSIDTYLNDFQAFFNSPDVQKYNPAASQPLVQAGTSPEGKMAVNQVLATANQGTKLAAGATPLTATGAYAAPPAINAQPQIYPTIASDQGGGQIQPGLDVERLKAIQQTLTPKPGGPSSPALTMPPGSQGQVSWGQ